jgi:uncharacterized protein
MSPRSLSEEWLARCAEFSLCLRRCENCNVNTFVLRQYCPACLRQLSWFPASESGTIFTFSIVRRSETTGAGAAAPYAVAYVELDDALLLTNVRHGDREPRIGDEVQLDWAVVADRVVPIFRAVKD